MEPKFFDNTNLQQPRNDPAYESKPSLDTTQSTISYRPDIDGLRGISVIAIVLFHLSKSIIPGGFVGVDMFFVISGFLVGKIILSEIANNKFTYENFYIRRVKRILPAAFVLLFLTLGAGFYVYGGVTTQFKSLTMATLYSAFSGANFYVCFVDSQSYFEPSTELKPLTHMWSLAVEEQFYLIWPFLLSYFYSFARRAADENKLLLKIVGAFTLSSFVLSEVLVRIKLDVAYYLLPSRMGELALGTLVSLLEPSCESLNSMLKNLISLVGTALFIVSFIFYNEKLSFPGFLSVVPSLGIALIILAGSEVIISRVYSLSIFRNIGLASYSIYLYHWPIMSFLRSLSYKFEGLNLVSILLFVGASSALSYFYVENGFRWVKWRNLVTFFALFVIPLVVLSTICAVFLYLPTPQYPIAVDNSTFSAEILRHFSPEEIRSANTYWTQNLKKIHSETGGLLGTLDSPHVVLIIGDSHALQFSSFIDQFQEASFPVKISVNVTNACPPLLYSADFLDRFQSQKCARFVRQTERNIESLGIKSVILVSWWRDLIGIAYEHNPVLQNPGNFILFSLKSPFFNDFCNSTLLIQ